MSALTSRDIRSSLYFSSHFPGTVDLVIDPAIRHADGPITLTAAAAEDLLDNLQINAEHARLMAEVAVKKDGPSG